jgi:hypothetical protein
VPRRADDPARLRTLVIAGVLLTGCAHLRVEPPPTSGWRELRSRHFRLRTDLPEGSARKTLEKLESVRWWLQSAWATGGDSPGITQAIVLASPPELRTFTEIIGLATTTREGPLLVTTGYEGLMGDRSPALPVLAHEVAHELIRRRMPGAPRWYQEGLAGYLEWVQPLDDRTVRFAFVQHYQNLRGEYSGTLEDDLPMLSLDATTGRHWETATDAQVGALYYWGRAWVAVLRAEEPARMRALDAALAAGTSWQRAWTDLRSQLDVQYLQEKLWRYLHAGGWPREVHEITPLDRAAVEPSSERELTSWEVHLTFADLWAMAARTKGSSSLVKNVRTELEAAAKEAPGEVVPQVRLAALERDPARRRARADELVARFPQSPEALVFRAAVLRDEGGPPEERRAAALAAIAAAPDNVDALTAHALEELRAGKPESALVTISHAVALEPWNSSVFVVRALVLGAIGRCEEAAVEAQRAIDVLPDDPVYGDLRALIDERDRIIKVCAPSKRP